MAAKVPSSATTKPRQKVHDFKQISYKDLKIQEEIGSGAFGTVYKAKWLPTRSTVAVKMLHLTNMTEKIKNRFLKEISLLQSTRCPNIVTFYGACMEEGKYALVMEYMSLGSLYKILYEDNTRLTWDERLSIAVQTTIGINYLHQLPEPILHRDIKSLNLLLERAYDRYTVKVCDFGVARTRNETIRQTTSNFTPAVTLQWTAPEILLLEPFTDKSDIYSLGIVYWELATCKIPYDGYSDGVIRAFVLAGDRLKIPKSTSSSFRDVIEQCWAQKPNDRPNSSTLIQIIEDCITKEVIPNIPANARWAQNGVTVASQLKWPHGLLVDDDQTVIVADTFNDCIIQWKKGDTNGQVIAGSNWKGNQLDQLNRPNDVLIDKETDSLIIADSGNRRVVRWSRRNGTKQGEILIDNSRCCGLAMDGQRYLYASDTGKHEVRRYRLGSKNGIVVAGGNGKGNGLNQLNSPTYLFVDREQNVYVSDNHNDRVMKWNKDANEGIVVAGGNGCGDALTKLNNPSGIFVDILGTLYVADRENNRVMRWYQGDKQGTVVVGGNRKGAEANQFNGPVGVSFDRHGNLYVVDNNNNRVQRFDMVK